MVYETYFRCWQMVPKEVRTQKLYDRFDLSHWFTTFGGQRDKIFNFTQIDSITVAVSFIISPPPKTVFLCEFYNYNFFNWTNSVRWYKKSIICAGKIRNKYCPNHYSSPSMLPNTVEIFYNSSLSVCMFMWMHIWVPAHVGLCACVCVCVDQKRQLCVSFFMNHPLFF